MIDPVQVGPCTLRLVGQVCPRGLLIEADQRRWLMGAAKDAALAELGIAPQSITDVVLSHLRSAHEYLQGEALRFVGARHHIQRRSLEHAKLSWEPGALKPLEPLLQSDKLVLWDGPSALAAGLELLVYEGLTVAQQLLWIRDPERPTSRWALFGADFLPSCAHLEGTGTHDVRAPQMPDVLAQERARIVGRAAAESGLLILAHDPQVALCAVKLDVVGRPRGVETLGE